MVHKRSFWVVSPNVRFNPTTKPEWTDAIVRLRSAFMGWGSDDKEHSAIGFKFAHLIKPGDVILVARRYHKKPDVVGVGVVVGPFEGYRESLNTPQDFGSRRRLRPFMPITGVPRGIPIMSALSQIKALHQLHPERNEDQKRVCNWMLQLLSPSEQLEVQTGSYSDVSALLRDLHLGSELEYKVQRREKAAIAKRMEAKLVLAYQKWLERKGRFLQVASYGRLKCDAFEESHNNLIEAKQSAKRELIRMAAGQLLDYAYVGRKQFGKPNMAILLPKRPNEDTLGWLKEIGIHIIWREGRTFRDNWKGQFT
jgi:hypothetical protein